MSYIVSYCHITSNKCFINGSLLDISNEGSPFIKNIYNSLGIKYSKFHKMDELAKTGFLGVELLKTSLPELANFSDDKIALLFSNNNSSAITDNNFEKSYKNGGSPSPALFVYTLPNILIGEIAIRNKWYGENIFTISKTFDPNYFVNTSNILLQKKSNITVCGWISKSDEEMNAFFFLVGKKDLKQLNLPLNSAELLKLINPENKE